MDDKFLQTFLKTGLFDIGESDERLTWLKKAIIDLQNKFAADRSLLQKYTLVALDPNALDSEPILIATEVIVTKYWEALRVRFPDMPRNIIRGVILNALYNIGNSDTISARIIYLTASSFYPYAKLNSEKGLVEKLMNELGTIAEANAIEEWSLSEKEPALKLGTLKLSDSKFSSIEIDKAKLQADMKIAIQNDSTNHGINHGANSTWGDHFSLKSSEAISKSIKSALEEFYKSLGHTVLESTINKFFVEFKKTLDSNLKIAFASLMSVERRSKLLWWKETMYSPSQKKSYRNLDKNLLPIIIGWDLNNQVSEITPASIDFLIRDILFLLNEKKDNRISFSVYLTEISKEGVKSILKYLFTNINESEGRISIMEFIALLLNDKVNINDFKERTGIDGKEQIKLSDLSVIIFHDLLIQRLIKL